MVVEAKICGVTRPEDAALAAAHGASRIGVILASGRRLVTPNQARAIVDAAAGVPVIGVVYAAEPSVLIARAREAGLAGVQLHGASTAELARSLGSEGFEVWRTAAIADGDPSIDALRELGEGADAVLVEPRVPGGSGGRGVPLSLDLARAARGVLRGSRMVLAGGLTPDTVAEAIRVVGPDLVDVSSGVETTPGIKEPGRLIRFLENVRDARAANRPGS